jgi:hypothetical protein
MGVTLDENEIRKKVSYVIPCMMNIILKASNNNARLQAHGIQQDCLQPKNVNFLYGPKIVFE